MDYKLSHIFYKKITTDFLKFHLSSKVFNSLVLLVFLFMLSILNSQQKKLDYHVKFSPNEIIIDGVADENSWKKANKMNANWQHFPNCLLYTSPSPRDS